MSSSSGLTFSLNGESIPNNNVSRISINDIAVSENLSNALICRSERTANETNKYSHGYLVGNGSIPLGSGNEGPRIFPGPQERGWDTRRGVVDNHRLHYLRRRSYAAEEGYYNCRIIDDINAPTGLYILYPSESLSPNT